MTEQNQQATVIACSLTDKELAARLDELTHELFANAEHVNEIEDGYTFQFGGSADQALRLTTLVLEERQCCPFLRFDLRFEPYEGPITLTLRSTVEVKAFTRLLVNDAGRRIEQSHTSD